MSKTSAGHSPSLPTHRSRSTSLAIGAALCIAVLVAGSVGNNMLARVAASETVAAAAIPPADAGYGQPFPSAHRAVALPPSEPQPPSF